MRAIKAISVALSPALLLTGTAWASGHEPVVNGTRLSLTAEGVVTRAPDIALINAGVVTEAPTAAAAMQQNNQRMAATVAALRKAGIAERDIQTAAITLNPQYRYAEGQPPAIIGYQASNQVQIRFRDVKRAGAILDSLVSVGANQINGPTLTIADPDAALNQARQAAVRTARERATLYAQAAGLQVSRILSITEQGENNPPRPMVMAMAKADAGMATPEILPGEQEVKITLTVAFELQ